MKTISTILLFITLNGVAFAQSIPLVWKQTTSRPEAEAIPGNTSLAIDKATNRIYVGTASGKLFISDDAGASWSQKLSAEESFVKIVVAKNSFVYAASGKKLFYSHDGGNIWKNVELRSNFPITDLLVDTKGMVYASTAGVVDIGNGVGDFRGTGIFRSTDNGKIWNKFYLIHDEAAPIYHLAQDSKGRMYAALNVSRGLAGGILYSKGPDSSWYYLHVPTMEWASGEFDVVKIYSVYSLEVDQHDSIYISFDGASRSGSNGNSAAASVILKNSFEGALRGDAWKHMRVLPFGFPWMYQPVHNLFFASDAKRQFSSIQHIPASEWGGTYYRSDNKRNWVRMGSGISLINAGYNIHHYGEDSAGKIYLIQEYDPRVYFFDPTIPSSIPESKIADNSVSIYPNPASACVTITSVNSALENVRLYDLSGRFVKELNGIMERTKTIHLDSMNPGLYLVHVTTPEGVLVKKLTVTQ